MINIIYGYIYAILSLLNGKYYIGQTTRDPYRRWWEHINQPSKYSYVDRAIQKYGSHNFIFEVIDTANNQEELNEKEEEYICLFSSKTTVNGYNIKDGGSNGKHSEETRRKLSEAQTGEKNYMYGKTGELNPCFLDLDVEEILRLYTEEKLSELKISKILNRDRSVISKRLEQKGVIRRGRSESHHEKSIFGTTGVQFLYKKQVLEGKMNPWNRVWRPRIAYKNYRTSLGVFEDPFTAELVYRLVWKEIYKKGD